MWRDWKYRQGLRLRHHDHAGVGSLELLRRPRSRLACWRYTLEGHAAAHAWSSSSRIGRRRDRSRQRAAPDGGGALSPLRGRAGSGVRGVRESAGAISTRPPRPRTLLRLWRFAKPYKLQLFIGFTLTLAATARDPGAALPHHAADGQGAGALRARHADRFRSGRATTRGAVRFRTDGLGARLGAYLHPGAGERAHRSRSAHHHLRASPGAFPGILRRQAHRRSDVAHRLGDRPHLHLPVPAPARLRDRRADDHADRGDPDSRSIRGSRS